MKLKIYKVNPEAKIPSYSHEGDAAFDLYSCEDIVLSSLEKKVIKTGIAMAIPKDYVGLIWDRSGLAAKHSITTLAGVVDSGYRGEISVVLINLGKQDFKVNKYDRIAQMLIQPVVKVGFEEVDNLSDTSRGQGGFGSTGY